MDLTSRRRLIFDKTKQQCLNKADLSRKGSIDEAILRLVEIINSNDHFYTTSTCSGRISLIVKPKNNPAIKKGGSFLLNSHEEISFDLFQSTIGAFVENVIKNYDDQCLWLKFEPFIMHIQCFDLQKAHSLLNTAIGAGCRNSGLTLGKNEKFLVAIRSTSSMEVPIHSGQDFQLDEHYLKFLCDECNRRLGENLAKLNKFQNQASALLSQLVDVDYTHTKQG